MNAAATAIFPQDDRHGLTSSWPEPAVWTRQAGFFTALLLPFPALAAIPPGLITGFHRDAAGVVQLDLSDPFQGSVTVERSVDLTTWNPLGTVSLADRTAVFTDSPSPPGMAFYRLAPPPQDYRGSQTVSMSDARFTVAEAMVTVSLPVVRNGPLDQPLDVPWSLVPDGATPGADYEPDSGIVHFASGASKSTIPLRVKADDAVEPDEAVNVVLSPVGAVATPIGTARVVIADGDSLVTTVVAGAGLQSSYWISDAGASKLGVHQGRLVWNGPGEGRIRSFAVGEFAPRTEAVSFGTPVAVATAGPWLVRLEASGGIVPGLGGCTGPDVVGKLVRSALDGSDPLVLARPALCRATPPPVVTADSVYFVETEVSPDHYHLRRVPINGGAVLPLLTVDHPLRSMLVAGPWLWCTEDRFPDPEGGNSILWRVAIDGSGAEPWITGFRAPRGALVRDENFLYLADSSYGGIERIQQVSPVERTARVVWETNDLWRESTIGSLTVSDGRLFWLDAHSLRTMPTSGGTARTLVDGIEFPGALAAGPPGIVWSQGSPNGQIQMYEPTIGAITTRVTSVRHPGPMLFAGETLVYTAGVGYDEGAGEILALAAGSDTPVPVAGGISVQQPEFAAEGAFVYAADKWNFKRLAAEGHPPAIIYQSTDFNSGFTADQTSVYWATEPQGSILAANHDGSQLRLLANAGGHPIALHVEGTDLFWIDEPSRIRSVPVAGGAVTDVLTGYGGISSYVVDGQNVYAALQDQGLLVRVPKAGGTVTPLTVILPFQTTLLAQTDSLLLWSSGPWILALPKKGGTPQVVVESLPESPSSITTDGMRVFWLEPTADRIRTVALPQ